MGYCVKDFYSPLFGIILITFLFFVIGVNLPYINVSEKQLIYYNMASQSRNKSYDDRVAVKNMCVNLIENADSDSKILVSAEFLYSIKYYQAYLYSKKNLNIDIYADIAQHKLSQDNLDNMVEEFLNHNLGSKEEIWFMGRNNEQYFQ